MEIFPDELKESSMVRHIELMQLAIDPQR